MYNTLKKILVFINRINAELSGAIVSLVALSLVVGFIMRTFGKPLMWVTELSTYGMIAIVYLGLAICQQNKNHIRVEMLIIKFPKHWYQRVNIFGLIMLVVFGSIMFYSSLIEAHHSTINRIGTPGLVPIPVYPAKIILSFGLFLFVIQGILDLVQEFKEPSKKLTEG